MKIFNRAERYTLFALYGSIVVQCSRLNHIDRRQYCQMMLHTVIK